MKKTFLIISIFIFSISLFAQMPTVVTKIKYILPASNIFYQDASNASQEGTYTVFDLTYKDTLKSADTLVYVFPITHSHRINPYIDLRWKSVAADTTVVITLWQSMTTITSAAGAKASTTVWYQVKSTTTPSAYTLTTSKTAVGNADIDFLRDVIWFDSRNLAIRLIAKTKTSFKSIPYGAVQFNYY